MSHYYARAIRTKRPCTIEGCDRPQIGLGEPNDVYSFSGNRGYAIRLCPADYELEQELKGLDPFTAEVRRRRLDREKNCGSENR